MDDQEQQNDKDANSAVEGVTAMIGTFEGEISRAIRTLASAAADEGIFITITISIDGRGDDGVDPDIDVDARNG